MNQLQISSDLATPQTPTRTDSSGHRPQDPSSGSRADGSAPGLATTGAPIRYLPRMTAAPPRKGKQRCRYCNDTLHWLGAGWGHDRDNMACCMLEIARTGKIAVAVPRAAR